MCINCTINYLDLFSDSNWRSINLRLDLCILLINTEVVGVDVLCISFAALHLDEIDPL